MQTSPLCCRIFSRAEAYFTKVEFRNQGEEIKPGQTKDKDKDITKARPGLTGAAMSSQA